MKTRAPSAVKSRNPNNPTKAPREQLRTMTPRVTSPRQTARPMERSRQRRSH